MMKRGQWVVDKLGRVGQVRRIAVRKLPRRDGIVIVQFLHSLEHCPMANLREASASEIAGAFASETA